jgi:diguanylate cyclase (GGDEF)-like protein/PAS domain S-box-containing protein
MTVTCQIDELLNFAPCGFLSFTNDGNILMVNATLLELLGYELNELLGKKIELILPISSRIFYQTHFLPLLNLHGKAEEIYFSIKSKSGNDIPMLVNGVCRREAKEVINHCIFVPIRKRIQYEDEILQAKKTAITAIFAQKKAEISLRQQSEQAKSLRKNRDFKAAIYNESTDAIFIVAVPSALIIDCNSRAVEMFEVNNKNELIGTDGQTLQKRRFTDDEIALILEDVAKLGFWSQEVEYITKKGNYFWGNLAVKRITIAGKVIDLMRVTDISNRKETELALQKSEAMLLEAQRIARIGNWEYDLITGKITWSTELFHILGRDQKLGEPTYEENLQLYHPEDAERLHQAIERALSTGKSYQLELRVVNADGSFRYTEGKGRTELNDEGKVIRLFGTSQDIRDRKQVENKLRESQHFIQKITEITPNLLYIYDLNEQCNVYINRSVGEILGYSAVQIHEMGANLFATICHPDDLPKVYEAIQQCHNLQNYEYIEIEYRVRDAQGEWCWLYSRDRVFSRTADGRIKQTLGTAQDITARKKAELALRKSEKRFQEISTSSPGVIYIMVKRLDSSWYFEYISDAFEDIHEISVEQALANANLWFEQFHPDDRFDCDAALSQSLETMSPFNYEWRIITPSGKTKWIKARSRPEQRENGEIAFYGVVLDVSEKARLEAERQEAELALRAVEHDLRLANQELEKQVNIDGLTQIANRRCFNNHLEQEWQRLYREQQFLSLLLFDVDYFKKYNDSYGHKMGDECLIKIAQAANEVVCRPVDLVARYGGEEFVVILPNTDLKGAITVAQKIHTAIQDLAIPHSASEVSDIVTISLGITSQIPNSEISPEDLIEQADQALYHAKQHGRNQSVTFC